MSNNNPIPGSDTAMSDSSAPEPGRAEANNRRFWLIGGVGCVILFFCVGLFIGSSILFVRKIWTAPTRHDTAASSGTAESQPSALLADMSAPNEPGAAEAGPVAGSSEMSPITFALETSREGEPVEPDFSFAEGTTQIHAVFEYANLSPDYTWTQVWYHDGDEVSRTSQPWLADASGTFDYVIATGDEPLPTGEWALEFYINDELLTAGSFAIAGQEETAAPVDLAEVPQIYLLVYTKWDGAKHNLYLNDTNGGQEQFILGRAAGPSWSLDSRYIFVYGEEGIDQLYPQSGVSNGIMRLTATALPAHANQIQLYQGYGWNDGTARWANVAPDGTMIAYDGDRGGGRRIYFLGTEANQQFRYEIIGEQADWSPDSQKIVYRSGRNNQTGIWISNRNDSGHTRITSDGSDSFPSWSPDGQTIAFSRDAGGNVDIYTVSVDGSNLQRLTDTPGHDTLPAYLPNGDLVFRSTRSGSWGIWKMKGDGSAQIEIISNAPVGPDWSFSRIGVLR